jgi:peptidoglycan L-alanyl-D-glutamate endopeptidase CwlK
MTLKAGNSGSLVKALQEALAAKGFDPGTPDGTFGPGTVQAVEAFQTSAGLEADGVAGPNTLDALGFVAPAPVASLIPSVTVDMACQIVPDAHRSNVEQNLPHVLNALVEPQLADKQMITMALATIRAETAGFEPINEGVSRFNTSPGGREFDLYDHILGNHGAPEGATFKGRGFIQLTGRDNYRIHGAAIGMEAELLANPDLANDPDIAGKLLASFLKAHEAQMREALANSDFAKARKLVNGGSHGLDVFTAACHVAAQVLPEQIEVAS